MENKNQNNVISLFKTKEISAPKVGENQRPRIAHSATLQNREPWLATSRRPDTTSNKYAFVNTMEVIKEFEALGLETLSFKAPNLKHGTGYQKHIVEFGVKSLGKKMRKVLGTEPRILLYNSHDGTQSLQLRLGLYRFVCSNGLVVGKNLVEPIKIRHDQGIQEQVWEILPQIAARFAEIERVISSWSTTKLTSADQYKFAQYAALQRGVDLTPVQVEKMLTPLRDADQSNDLWTVYNLVQEKCIQGRFVATRIRDGKLVKPKQLKSIQATTEINQNLFDFASALFNEVA